jgi:protein-tyrosine phosphatase
MAACALSPLPIAGPGAIALIHCPGRNGDLDGDVAVMIGWRATRVLSLVEDQEFADRDGLAARLGRAGIRWMRHPIPDFGTPPDEAAWRRLAAELLAGLGRGERLVIHCRAGLGRSGMIAARLLVERGLAAADAIAVVRNARPGAIETAEQEAWIGRV